MKGKSKNKSGYIFVGFTLLGMGTGMLFNQTAAGMFIGMGLGFIISGIYRDLLEKFNGKRKGR